MQKHRPLILQNVNILGPVVFNGFGNEQAETHQNISLV